MTSNYRPRSQALLTGFLKLRKAAGHVSCGSTSCPFFELRAEAGPNSKMEAECIIADAVQKVEFKKGDFLFLQGQLSSSLYTLSAGMVKICSDGPDGWEQIVGLATPGNLLVGLQSLNGDRYAYTAIASTAVSACEINHRALLAHAEDDVNIAMHLITAVNAQLAHSRALVEVMGHEFADSKNASLILLMTPEESHGHCCYGLPCSRLDMANILGLREETVCRQMAEMQRSEVINAPRGKIEVRDWKKLQAIATKHFGGHRAH